MRHKEEEQQEFLFNWIRTQTTHATSMYGAPIRELDYAFHVPNGGWRAKGQARRFKAMGVRAGVSDVFWPVPRGPFAGLWAELKVGSNGLEDAQREWLAAMLEQGYAAGTVRGTRDYPTWKQAADFMLWYWELGESYLKTGEFRWTEITSLSTNQFRVQTLATCPILTRKRKSSANRDG